MPVDDSLGTLAAEEVACTQMGLDNLGLLRSHLVVDGEPASMALLVAVLVLHQADKLDAVDHAVQREVVTWHPNLVVDSHSSMTLSFSWAAGPAMRGRIVRGENISGNNLG